MSVQFELTPRRIASWSLVVKNLSPAWFAAVMGTGIFAVASKYYACYWSWLNSAALLLWIINSLLFVGLVIPWSLRWLLFRDDALKDLHHPVTGQFYATLPIGCLVLAADFLLLGTGYLGASLAVTIAKGLWIAGFVLSLAAAVMIPVQNYFRQITLEHINPAWFMPPVGLIVAPIAGAALIPYWPHLLQKSLLLINYAAWGAGFFLFMLLAAICFYRFFMAPPLPGTLIPTIWIFLGPIGAGTVSLLNLGAISPPFLGGTAMSICNMLALFFWGFGFWWLLAASLVTIIYIYQKNLPYSLSWWAFTFPLGAYTVATYLISINGDCEAVRLWGLLCYGLLAFCWLAVFGHTFVHVCRGTFFTD